MKTNLISQIKLDRTPKKYYAPVGEIELAALTRNERVYTKILESSEDAIEYLAEEIIDVINKTTKKKGKCVIALGSGTTKTTVYNRLVELYNEGKVNFENVIVFNLSELYSEGTEIKENAIKKLQDNFLSKVNIKPENIPTFDTNVDIYH